MWRYAALLLLVSVTCGGWWREEEECDGDVCFPARIELDLYKPAASRSGLGYRETIEVTSSVRDVLSLCLPNTDPSFVANNFLSCEDKAMKTVCKMAKRNWLVNNEHNQTVANSDLLLSNLKDLAGAEEAVKECLKVPEEYEYEYEYYDYDYDYLDEYDYLEEAAGEVRVRREAGKGGKKERPGRGNGGGKNGRAKHTKKNNCKKGKKCANKRNQARSKKNSDKPCRGKHCNGKKNGQGNRKDNRQSRKINGKNNNKNGNKDKGSKEDKTKNKKKKAKGAERKSRKYTKERPDNKEKVDKEVNSMLSSLGLASLPSKADLDSLHCVYHQVASLLRDCAQDKLNQ